MLLATYGMDHLLVNARPTTSGLVRPDRFVAWRAPAASEDPRRALAEAFSQILARPVDATLPLAAGAT